MRWVKHMTKSANDPDLYDSFLKFEEIGPFVFWKIVELIGSEFNPHEPGVLRCSVEWFEHQMWISSERFMPVLMFFASRPLKKHKPRRFIFKEYNEAGTSMLEITCPGFAEIADDYTKRLLKEIENGK